MSTDVLEQAYCSGVERIVDKQQEITKTGGTVLVVDDENGPRQALRMLLNECYSVHMASDVETALRILDAVPVNLVITDLRMPRETGVDLLIQVKERHPEVQVIILTGYGQLDTAMKAVEYGAFAYLEKPFDNDDMLQHVEAALQRYNRERERRIMEELAFEANRFETLGRVMAGMVHDLGTPLSVLEGQIEFLKIKSEHVDLPKRLDTMQAQVHHCCDMVRNTMGFMRSESTRGMEVSLSHVVEECLKVGGHTLRDAKVTVQTTFSAEPVVCVGEVVLIRQAVLNLINNACQALARREAPREIHIRTWAEDTTVCLSVADNGEGIPAMARDKIFDTFYTTKGKEGTGLGLAVVRSVMTRHGGQVSLGQAPGGGAEFTLRFPKSATRQLG